MQNPDPQEIARMLRQPAGTLGVKVAEKMNESNAHIIRSAIEKLHLQDNDKVLEIGFGNGFHIKGLLEGASNIQYTGLDFSDTMVEIASKSHEAEMKSAHVSFHLGSSVAMPFFSESFDKIFTVNTIYFWDDPSAHLQQIYKVLKPGGIFCIAFKSRSFMQHLPIAPHGFTLYEQEEVVTLLKENEFIITEIAHNTESEREIAGKLLAPDANLVAATKN